MRIAYCGVRFFFQNVLKREWHIFTYMNAKREKKLPCILSREEVFKILDQVTTFHNYAFLSTVYSCVMNPSCAISIEDIRTAMEKTYQLQSVESCTETEAMPQITCPHCGGELKYLKFCVALSDDSFTRSRIMYQT